MHEYSIYNLINLFLRILGGHFIFSSPQHKEESPEARAGPVSSSERLVPWTYALLAKNAGTVVAPAVPRRMHTKARAYTNKRIYSRVSYTRRSFSFLCLVRSLARGLLCRFYSRIRQSRQNARGARTAVQPSPCVSNWYPKSASNPVEFFSRKRTLDVRYTMSFRITIRGRFA